MPGPSPTPAQRPNSGRRQQFEELYSAHSREVWAAAFARRMDSHLALDIMQEAFLRLWKQWEQGEEIDNPRAWLLRVARNLAEDAAKSAFRRHGTHETELLNGVAALELPPDEQAEQAEQFRRLRAFLEELSPTDREILTLRYALDYDTATIAARLNIAVAAVHMRLSRARHRLAERIQAAEAANPTPPTPPASSTAPPQGST